LCVCVCLAVVCVPAVQVLEHPRALQGVVVRTARPGGRSHYRRDCRPRPAHMPRTSSTMDKSEESSAILACTGIHRHALPQTGMPVLENRPRNLNGRRISFSSGLHSNRAKRTQSENRFQLPEGCASSSTQAPGSGLSKPAIYGGCFVLRPNPTQMMTSFQMI
jgi:hypothetical protein